MNLEIRWVAFVLSASLLAGCSKTVHFRTIDAVTRRTLTDVHVERHHTKRYGALRIEGDTDILSLGSTDHRGRVGVSGVTGNDSIVFDKDGYWPAIYHADFPGDHITSRPRDAELDKTGLIGLDAIRAVKARIHKQLGVNEGGQPAKKEGGVVIVPLYPARERQ